MIEVRLTCAVCGKEFGTTSSRAKYCSRECFQVSYISHAPEGVTRAEHARRLNEECYQQTVAAVYGLSEMQRNDLRVLLGSKAACNSNRRYLAGGEI